ncbi:MAG: TadE family type IV pilus minor pilin [Acidimicrobiia bacterium]
MERGSLTVEAAFVIPFILVVLMAVVEVVAAIGTHLELVAAAREGARVAATAPDPAQAATAARSVVGSGMRVQVLVVRPDVVGRQAQVTVSYDKPLISPLLSAITVPMRARAVMRVER